MNIVHPNTVNGPDSTTITTINHLPPEILSIALLLTVQPDPDDHGWPDHGLEVYTWNEAVELSLVCRAWRSIALGTPSMWTYLRSPRPSMLLGMLQRSGSLPLKLWIDDAANLHTLPLTGVAPRLEELTVSFSVPFPSQWFRIEEHVTEWGTTLTPVLKSLIFRVESHGEFEVDDLDPVQHNVSDRVLSVPMPALRELILRGFGLPEVPFPVFPQLQKFHLSIGNEWPPDVSSLLSALAAMPVLVECEILLDWDSDRDDPDDRTGDLQAIELPSLTSLDLVIFSYDYCASLLRSLRLPSLVQGHWAIRSAHQDHDGFIHQISQTLQTMGICSRSGAQKSRPHRLAKLYFEKSYTTLGVCHATDSLPFDQHDDDLRFPIEIRFDHIYQYPEPTISAILKGLLIDGLHQLTLAYSQGTEHHPNTRVKLCMMLESHKEIRHLRLEGCEPHIISDVIASSWIQDAPFLPDLESLLFTDCILPGMTVFSIVEFVHQLMDEGVNSIQRIIFKNCRNFSDSSCQEMEEELPAVEICWDGVEFDAERNEEHH